MTGFEPPPDWPRITTIDAHTAGEPLRVVTDGFPEPRGATMLERRRHARDRHDHLRRALMLEPRGHADMYGCFLTPPATPDGDIGVLFLHNEGYSTMCGHGIIALVKVGIECGLFEVAADEPVVRIDTPAGRVTATAHLENGRVREVSFRNVASFVLQRGLQVEVSGLGTIPCDIAFGGAFYAYVDARVLGIPIRPESYDRLIDAGMRIKHAVASACEIRHPEGDDDLGFLYGTIMVEPGGNGIHSRNCCVFADGEVDRSPTGTGVSGRAALLHASGEIEPFERITIESLIGTRFDVRVVETTSVGGLDAVIPEVWGSAHITGRHEFFIDPEDPLRDGILLGRQPSTRDAPACAREPRDSPASS